MTKYFESWNEDHGAYVGLHPQGFGYQGPNAPAYYKAAEVEAWLETWVRPIIACVANGQQPSVILVQDAQRVLTDLRTGGG